MAKPFKIACLYIPSKSKTIIENLVESGFGENDAL